LAGQGLLCDVVVPRLRRALCHATVAYQPGLALHRLFCFPFLADGHGLRAFILASLRRVYL
jgi:hypothetical protein